MRSSIHLITESVADRDRSPKIGSRLDPPYVLANMARVWERWGHPVTQGAVVTMEADIGIVHLDQTRVDRSSLPKASDHQRILNERVTDISKRSFSTLVVEPDDAWPGPVIVKSNLNFFGEPERKRTRPGLRARSRRVLARWNWRAAGVLPRREYPVLRNLSMVPRWVWQRGDLLVERFLPEREGDLYSIRGWMFFGKRGYGYRLFSTDPMVKTAHMVGHEYLDVVPPELEAFRLERGFDFGKFDYVEVEGRPVLLDINKTPTFAGDPNSPRLLDLAKGINDFMGTEE